MGLVQFGGIFVKTVPLNYEQWVKCVLLGAMSLPLGGFMRLIPVSENMSDYAVISPLIADTKHIKKSGDEVKSAGGKWEPSFLVWLAVVTVIPVVTYSHFEQSWNVHLANFVGHFVKLT